MFALGKKNNKKENLCELRQYLRIESYLYCKA